MTSITDFALDAARRGFRVFPLLPDSKKPAIPEWQFAATRDEARIKEIFQGRDWNYGMTLDGIGVADIDPRNGGNETFRHDLQTQHGLTAEQNPTLVVKTHSGGLHMFYELPDGERLKSRAHALGQGVDLKTGAGAYVVGPGSTINGNAYEILRDRPIAPMPASLIELAKKNGRPSEKSKAAGEVLAEETDDTISRGEAHIRNRQEVAEGDRDNEAFRVAAALFDLPVSKPTALELLTEWNETKCSPPLSPDVLAQKVESAFKNRQNAIGVNSTSEGFHPEDIEERPKQDKQDEQGDLFELFDEAAAKALTESANPLVKGLLDRGALSTWYGPPKTGKTFILLWLAVCVAAGIPFAGRKTHRGAVVYIAMEGTAGILKRLKGIRVQHPELDLSSFAIVRRKIDLLHNRKSAVELVADICRQVTKKTGLPVELIVIDTVARAIGGGDENSPVDMGALVDSFDRIRAATGAHLAAIHHTSKGNPHAARGFGGLLGALDSEFEIQKGLLRATNMREAEEGMMWGVKLEPVVLGTDEDGEPITTRVVEIVKREDVTPPPTGREAAVLDVIRKNAGREPFSPSDVMEWLKTDLKLELSLSRVSQVLKKLGEGGAITRDEHGKWSLIFS